MDDGGFKLKETPWVDDGGFKFKESRPWVNDGGFEFKETDHVWMMEGLNLKRQTMGG